MRTDNKDNLYNLFKEGCPDPEGEKDFTERLSKRIVVPEIPFYGRSFRSKVINFVLSPVPLLLVGIFSIAVFRNDILDFLSNELSQRITGVNFGGIPFVAVILACSVAIICIIVAWKKLLDSDYGEIDIREIQKQIKGN